MAKVRTITVSYPHYDDKHATVKDRNKADRVYRVEKVTDSLLHSPGSQLSKAQMEVLCLSDAWKVIVVGVNK